MIEINNPFSSVMDRGRWAARGTSFAAKVKATKLVWFPPKPTKAGKKAASGAKKTTQRGTKKSASAAKRATTATKSATRR